MAGEKLILYFFSLQKIRRIHLNKNQVQIVSLQSFISLSLVFLFLALTPLVCQSQVNSISVWPKNRKPNFNGQKVTDSIFKDWIFVVSDPKLHYFPPPKERNTGTAVLLCPGGGYLRLPNMKEPYKLAKWFNEQGIHAFVLISRLPHQADLTNRSEAPLQDAQRAVKIIRANAVSWSINPKKVGVMGTSAGGHVASILGTRRDDVSLIHDALDSVDFRPDFMVLLSPVITMGPYTHSGSRENLLGADTASPEKILAYSNETHVSQWTPPTLLIHAFDDRAVPAQNSLMFFRRCLKTKSARGCIFSRRAHIVLG